MKAIINGRRYDTDAAQKLGTFNANEDDRLTWVTEELYQKRTGEFFLAGEGGAMSRYAARTNWNHWKGGACIIPLEREEARQWAEQHLSADAYAQLFEVIPDDDAKPEALHVQLPPSLMAQVRRKAHERGLTLRDVVTQALTAYVAE